VNAADLPWPGLPPPEEGPPPPLPPHGLPALAQPPAVIVVTAVVDEFDEIAIADRRAVNREILQEDRVLRLLVVPGEILAGVTEREQSAPDLSHPGPGFGPGRRAGLLRVVEVTEQMLDVVDQQLLMLHLVLQSHSHEREDLFSVRPGLDIFQKSDHRLVNVISIPDGILHRRARACAAQRFLDALAEPFVVRVEVIKILFVIYAITREACLKQRLGKP